MIPQELSRIANFLLKQPILLTRMGEDGRADSIVNENEIIHHLERHLTQIGLTPNQFIVPRAREWYDFALEITNKNGSAQFYPINIKVTDTTHADNLSCKLGIYYALTGMLPDFPNEIKWQIYFNKLKQYIGKNTTKDYYFLVVNKDNEQDVFCNTLKGLSSLQPNGNNLPFQCRWDSNREYISRDFSSAKQLIMSTFAESIKLRSDIYIQFKNLFPEYV